MPLREQEWSHRVIRTKEKYMFPPSQVNIFKINPRDFSETMKSSDRDVVRALALDLNLGGAYAEEICYRAKVDKNRGARDLNDEEIEVLFEITYDKDIKVNY